MRYRRVWMGALVLMTAVAVFFGDIPMPSHGEPPESISEISPPPSNPSSLLLDASKSFKTSQVVNIPSVKPTFKPDLVTLANAQPLRERRPTFSDEEPAPEEPIQCEKWFKRAYLIKHWPTECLQRFIRSISPLRAQAMQATPIALRGPMDRSHQAWNSFIQAYCPTVTSELLLCQAAALHAYHGIRKDSFQQSTYALNYLQGIRYEYWDHLLEAGPHPDDQISSAAYSFLMETLKRHQRQRFTLDRAAFLNWFDQECQTFRQFMAHEGMDATEERVCYPLLYLAPATLFLNKNLTPHEWEQWDELVAAGQPP